MVLPRRIDRMHGLVTLQILVFLRPVVKQIPVDDTRQVYLGDILFLVEILNDIGVVHFGLLGLEGRLCFEGQVNRILGVRPARLALRVG